MNSTIWENNIQVIGELYPGLAELLAADAAGNGEGQAASPGDGNGSVGDSPAADIRVEAAATGEPVLTIGGKYVHSPRDPVREGRRAAEALEAGEGPVVVLGFGLGYAAEAVQRPVIVVERRKAVLRAALENRDLREFLSTRKIVFVLGGESSGVTGALRLFEGKPDILRNRTLMALDEDWYADVERHIHTWAAKDDVNQATLRRFGKRWVRNLAINMTAIRDAPGIAGLAGCLAPSAGTGIQGTANRAVPVLLAAAGPSLDRIGPYLNKIAERCVIVAVDTSLRFLLNAGVDPDFALVVDPQYWNYRHLDRAAAPRTCLVAESAVFPPVLRHSFGRTLLCSSLFPLGRFIEDRVDTKGMLGAGGSVATTAWDFARILGTDTIWIAGLDLGFPGLKTHFRGALFEERSHAESTRFAPGETWSVRALRDGHPFRAPATDGGQVLTDRRLSLYSAWFENRFRRFPAIRSRSLSPGGLAIPGLETASIEELLTLPPRREAITARLKAAFEQVEGKFFSTEKVTERAAQYNAARKSLLKGLETIRATACEAAALAEKALGTAAPASPGGRASHSPRLSPAEQERILAKLDRANRLITESEVKDVAGFLFPPMAELEAGMGCGDGLNRHLEFSAKLYRALAEAAGYNLSILSR
ncbi:hypothetical protein FACS189483_03790 [Spirochaetia bacterium]|nr:hypothetical protein FACS189483_03790 [Spirochaetia bacterium]